MIVGCYSLDLYCDRQTGEWSHDTPSEGVWNYTGRTRAQCLQQAKRAGWSIGKTRQLCPKCNPRYQAARQAAATTEAAQQEEKVGEG